MPTYDYVCDACEHAFDHFQSMSSNILRTCPKCKKRKLRRLIGSGAGVIFKGTGFYETDYKKKSKPSKPETDSSSSDSTSESKSESKTESKSASDAKTSSDSGSSKKNETSKD
jgi:putative FmdB family regulatory protein